MDKKFSSRFFIVALISSLIFINKSFSTNFEDKLTAQLITNTDEIKNVFSLNAISLSVLLPSKKQIDIVNGTLSTLSQNEATTNDLFEVGSLTKTFTASLILQLNASGKIK